VDGGNNGHKEVSREQDEHEGFCAGVQDVYFEYLAGRSA